MAERGLKSGFCFAAGTQVATPTGLKNIEDIKVGDLVLGYYEQTGTLKAEPVTGLIRPEPKPTYALVFKGEHGEADTFRATADHPWFTPNHRWVHTADLKAGDKIETATGEDFTLVAVKLSGKIERTYNLEVNGLYTFLVGKNHLVVHNSVCNLIRQALNKMRPSLWMREAAENPEKYTVKQLERMRVGKTPIGSDANPMEFHHKISIENGGTNDWDNLSPMTRTEHRLGENYKINHP